MGWSGNGIAEGAKVAAAVREVTGFGVTGRKGVRRVIMQVVRGHSCRFGGRFRAIGFSVAVVSCSRVIPLTTL